MSGRRRMREDRRAPWERRTQHDRMPLYGGAPPEMGLGKRLLANLGGVLMTMLVSILPVSVFLSWWGRRSGAVPGLLFQLVAFFVWFLIVFGLIRGGILLRHRRKGGFRPHPSLFENALVALDQISRGDFDVVVTPDRYGHYVELIDKINEMARNLSTMEHMRQDFVGNVSHEIGSPLTSIQGFARLLRREDLDPEQREHYLEVIEAECRRLRGLSENLLKLSLLDSESQPARREPMRLDRQLAHVVLLLEPQWLEKNLDLQAELDPVELAGDEELLEQLWINLIQNAVKFTPEGGTVTVRLTAQEDAVVTVTDSGIGMSPEDLPHIFERFYKADRARTRGAGGSGLGLSLARRIAELHGGRIEVDSTPGQGSTFRVRLPLHPPDTE